MQKLLKNLLPVAAATSIVLISHTSTSIAGGHTKCEPNHLSSIPADVVMSITNWSRTPTEIPDALAHTLRLYDRLDGDGNGLTLADQKFQDQKLMAQKRIPFVSKWLAKDLNGDGSVSMEEIRHFNLAAASAPLRSAMGTIQPTQEQIDIIANRLAKKELRQDTNGDGNIDIQEIIKSATDTVRKHNKKVGYQAAPIPISLDVNEDGEISRGEFKAGFASYLKAVDCDSNGELDQWEITVAHQYRQKLRRELALSRRTNKNN